MSRRVPCPDWLDSSRRFTPTQASRLQKKARLSVLATATLLAASIGVFAQTDEATQPQALLVNGYRDNNPSVSGCRKRRTGCSEAVAKPRSQRLRG